MEIKVKMEATIELKEGETNINEFSMLLATSAEEFIWMSLRV